MNYFEQAYLNCKAQSSRTPYHIKYQNEESMRYEERLQSSIEPLLHTV